MLDSKILKLKPATDSIDDGPNTEKYQIHVVSCYDYELLCVDEQYFGNHKAYFGEDAFWKIYL